MTSFDINSILEKMQSLEEENGMLKKQNSEKEQELAATLEVVKKTQNIADIEKKSLSTELFRVNANLKTANQKTEAQLAELNKAKLVFQATCAENKTRNDQLCIIKSQLEQQIVQKRNDLVFNQNEKELMRKSFCSQLNVQEENIRKLENERTELLLRAKTSDLYILQFKREEFLKRINLKMLEANKSLKEVQHGCQEFFAGKIPPAFENLKRKIQAYIKSLEIIRDDFVATVEKQVQDVEKGISLSSMKEIEFIELLPIPSLTPTSPIDTPLMPLAPQFMPRGNATNVNFKLPNTNHFSVNQQMPVKIAPPPGLLLNATLPVIKATVQKSSVNSAASFNISNASQKRTESQSVKANSSELENTLRSLQTVAKSITAPVGTNQTSSFSSANTTTTSSSKSQFKEPNDLELGYNVKPDHESVSLPASRKNSLKTKQQLPVQAVTPETKVEIATTSHSLNATRSTLSSDAAETNKSAEIRASMSNSLELGYNVGKREHRIRERSASESQKNETVNPKNSKTPKEKSKLSTYEKLIVKLSEELPEYTKDELVAYVADYRQIKANGLTGQSLKAIVAEISQMINSRKSASQARAHATTIGKKLVSKRLMKESIVEATTATAAPTTHKKNPWGLTATEEKKFSGNQTDEECVICFENMTQMTAYQVDCGHVFHIECIRPWIQSKSDCPICRKHLLLKEDFPSL